MMNPVPVSHVSRAVLTVLLALVTLSLTVVPASAVQDLGAEQQFIQLINDDRRAAGLQKLAAVTDVRNVALAWSNQMASERRMYHNPNYHNQYGHWLRAAENVGWTTVSDINDPSVVSAAVKRLHAAFMDSSGHRANLMRPEHDHIGLAIEMRAQSCPDAVAIRTCMWATQNFRQWDGTQPAGGLSNPYAGDRDTSGETSRAVTVSDEVHDGGFDGDNTTVERLGRTANSAIQISKARFGQDQARHAVVSRNDRFPDSLAGTPLTADGPLLLTSSDSLYSNVATELQRALPIGATVYLLGGEQALSEDVETQVLLAGLRPVRLAGATRVDTALAVADEVRRVYGDTGTVVVARSHGAAGDVDGPSGWVDSVTGGAWAARHHAPMIITPPGRLPPNVRNWLVADNPQASVVMGGTAAVSDAAYRSIPRPKRVYGTDRTATAATVAHSLWGVTPKTADRRFIVIDGWDRMGWRHGLAAAGLAADAKAPILLALATAGGQPQHTSNLVASCATPSVDLLLAGPLTNAVASTLESLDGRAC